MADGVAFAGARFVPEEVLTALRHFFRDLNARPQMLLSEKDLSARFSTHALTDGLSDEHTYEVAMPDGDPVMLNDIMKDLPKAADDTVSIKEFIMAIYTRRGTDLTDDSWWEDDLQYKSLYLDRKDELDGENAEYLKDHQAVNQMCSDFLVHLLQRKPDDVFNEARVFFSALAPQTQTN